jgi:hypothetical protein
MAMIKDDLLSNICVSGFSKWQSLIPPADYEYFHRALLS